MMTTNKILTILFNKMQLFYTNAYILGSESIIRNSED